MVPADEPILRLLGHELALELTLGNIARNVSFSKSHVMERLNILTEKGLVETLEGEESHNFYRGTGLARRYYDREISAEKLQEL